MRSKASARNRKTKKIVMKKLKAKTGMLRRTDANKMSVKSDMTNGQRVYRGKDF